VRTEQGTTISTDPEKIKSVKEWPTSTIVKDVQHFVGLCNYYRKFVEKFAQIARPLVRSFLRKQITNNKMNTKIKIEHEKINSFYKNNLLLIKI